MQGFVYLTKFRCKLKVQRHWEKRSVEGLQKLYFSKNYLIDLQKILIQEQINVQAIYAIKPKSKFKLPYGKLNNNIECMLDQCFVA